jgi:hypothetical protein
MNFIHITHNCPTVSSTVGAGLGAASIAGAGGVAALAAGAGRGGPVTASTLVRPLAIHAAISSSYRTWAAGDPH